MSGLHAVQSEPEARHKRSQPEHNLHDQASKCKARAAVECTPQKPRKVSGSSCFLFCCCSLGLFIHLCSDSGTCHPANRGSASNTTTWVTNNHLHNVPWKRSAFYLPNTGAEEEVPPYLPAIPGPECQHFKISGLSNAVIPSGRDAEF